MKQKTEQKRKQQKTKIKNKKIDLNKEIHY